MGDEPDAKAKVYYGITNQEKIVWNEVGESVSLEADNDEPYFKLPDIQEGVLFEIKLPWYWVNEWYEIFTDKLRFTVRTLNKRKSWRGRWHRGGKGRV